MRPSSVRAPGLWPGARVSRPWPLGCGEVLLLDALDVVARALVAPVLWWVFLNGWDELFVDCTFLWVALTGRARTHFLDEGGEPEERKIAVFVPLWREFSVIEQMVDHNVAAIDYRNYEIFLGVYPNDPHTIERAIELEERYPHVHRAECPHDGPTTKADCLNWVYQRMLLEEQRRGVRYEIIVQHDAEDVIHPRALKLVNRLAGAAGGGGRAWDMVQLPVFPLATPLWDITHGTYCDEFAEFQVKDLLVRQALGGFMPSTGVGTAFRREALERLAAASQNRIFSVTTFTEDYEIGLRLRMHGCRQVLVAEETPAGNGNGNGRRNGSADGKRNGNGNGKNGNANGRRNGNGNGKHGSRLVATREYFPRSFRLAVLQKSRWVLGVSLQAWEQAGWPGGWRQRYWLWRDRKGLIGNLVTFLSNVLFAYCLFRFGLALALGIPWGLSRIFVTRLSWLLIACNLVFLVNRLAFRVYCCARVYGWRTAVWSVPRTWWGNTLNFCATARAIGIYLRARLLGQPLLWSKTSHAYPDRQQLVGFKRPLGEILLEIHAISAADLEQALNGQQQEPQRRLGEILAASGRVTDSQVVEALGRQNGVEVFNMLAERTDPLAARTLPAALAGRYGVVPVARRNAHKLVVVAVDLLPESTIEELSRVTGLNVTGALATRSDWEAAYRAAYGAEQGLVAGAD